MCVAILNMSKHVLDKEELRIAWRNKGHDGGGLGWFEKGRAKRKIFYNPSKNWDESNQYFEIFYQAYLDLVEKFPNQTIMVHMRIRTHGQVDDRNAHPFILGNKKNGEYLAMHNGTITNITQFSSKETAIDLIKDSKTKQDLSDTYTLMHWINKIGLHNVWNNDLFWYMLDEFVDPSRIVFLKSNGEFRIVGEDYHEAHWRYENERAVSFFSNKKYIDQTRRKVSSSMRPNYNDWWDQYGTTEEEAEAENKGYTFLISGKYPRKYQIDEVGKCACGEKELKLDEERSMESDVELALGICETCMTNALDKTIHG